MQTSHSMRTGPMALLQVRAFKAVYRGLEGFGYSGDERFVLAICQTSDTVFKNADPELINEWVSKHMRKHTRKDYLKGMENGTGKSRD